jgi:hypothetical protein
MSSPTSFGHIPTKKQLNICQGSTLSLSLTFRDSAGALLNLTGYTFRGQIRSPALSTTISASFTFDTSSAASGVIGVSLTDTQTMSLTAGESINSTESKYQYDMEYVQPGGSVTRFLEGVCIVNRNVTRPST